MEVTPDVSKIPEGILATDTSSSPSRKPESGLLPVNGSETVANRMDSNAGGVRMDIVSTPSEDTSGSGTVKEGKKRAATDDTLGAGDVEGDFSTNSHNGLPGVNGMAKVKPAPKKPKLEESKYTREPACWRCREANIPCIGSSTRSSCNACFHHHWKCATNPPTVRGKKPKNNTISANALKHLLSHPVGSKNTRSKGTTEKGNTISIPKSARQTLTETPPPHSASTSAHRETASAPAPTAKDKEKSKILSLAHPSRPSTSTSSDLPVLMLAPPSVYIPPLKLGPPAPSPASILTSESSMSASASAASGSRHNRNPTRPKERGASRSRRKVPVPPALFGPVGDKTTSGDKILGWPGQTQTRANPGRSARPVRREFDMDTDEEEEEGEEEEEEGEEEESERATFCAVDKGKQKAHESGDISELSSPPSSTGSTPDPSSTMTFLFPTAALEPRSLPASSTLPTVVTTLNALTNEFKAMRTDLGEVKDVTATLSGSKSSLDWGIALDKLNKQENLINQQSKVIEAQGKMINAMVRNLKELMGERFVLDPDMDEVDEGGGGAMKCNAKFNGTTTMATTSGSRSVVTNGNGGSASRVGGSNAASQIFDMALRPVVTDISTNSGSSTSHIWGPVVDTSASKGSVYAPSRPTPVRKLSSGSSVPASHAPTTIPTSHTPTTVPTSHTPTTIPTSHTPTTTMLSTHSHDLPPPRAISFMRPQQKAATTSNNDFRNQANVSKPAAAAGEVPVAASSSSSTPASNVSEERPKLSFTHWLQTKADDDSDEEKDELLDDSPMQPNVRQRAWVKTQMMALR